MCLPERRFVIGYIYKKEDCDCRYASREELSEAICNKYHVADDKSNRKDIPDGSFRVEEAMAERHYSSKKAAARHKGLRTNLGQDGGTM